MKTILCVILLALALSTPARENPTQDEKEKKLEVSGFGRASAFILTKKFDYSMLFSEFTVKTEGKFNQAFIKSDLRLRAGSRFNSTFAEYEIKELAAGFQNDKLSVLLGNQVVPWGRADGFNPTSNITPVDYFFFSSDADDQYISNFMLNAIFKPLPFMEIQLIGVPVYKPSLYRYNLFDLGQNVIFRDMENPAINFKHSTLAGRLNIEFPLAGFSLSWFDGYNTFHGFDTGSINFDEKGAVTLVNVPKPYHKQAFGTDFSFPAGAFVIKGEAALNLPDKTEAMYIPKKDFSYVAGVEKDWANASIILQYVGKSTPGFIPLVPPDITKYNLQNPLEMMKYASDAATAEMSLFNRKLFQQDFKTHHALSLFASKQLFHEALKLEIATFGNFTTHEFLFRPMSTWNINDNMKLSIAGNYMTGPDKSIFRYSGKVFSGLQTEFRILF